MDDCQPSGGLLAGGDRDEPYDARFAFGRPQVHPRWLHICEVGALVDGTTGKTCALQPSDTEWVQVTRIVPACH